MNMPMKISIYIGFRMHGFYRYRGAAGNHHNDPSTVNNSEQWHAHSYLLT